MNKQVVFGVLISYMSLIVVIFTGIILTPFLINNLGDDTYGLYRIIGGLIAYFVLLDVGLESTIVRFISKYRYANERSKINNFLSVVTLIYIIFSSLIIIVGVIFYFNLDTLTKDVFNLNQLIAAKEMLVFVLISSTAIVLSNIFSGILNGFEQFIAQRLIKLIKNFIIFLATLIVTIVYKDAVIITATQAIIHVVFLFFNFIVSKRITKFKLNYSNLDFTIIKDIFNFSFFIVLQTLMAVFYWKIGETFIGFMLGTTIVAIYSVAMEINTAFYQLSYSITGLILPKATQKFVSQADSNELDELIIKTGRMTYIVYGFFAVLFILYGKELITVWINTSFIDAYSIVLIVTLTAMYSRVFSSFNEIAKAYNRHIFFTNMYFFSGLINIILTYIFIKWWGINGAAWATGINLVIFNSLISTIFMKKVFNINIKKIMKETFFVLTILLSIIYLIGFLISINQKNTLFNITLTIICLSIIYGVLVYKFSFNKEEKKMILRIIKRK